MNRVLTVSAAWTVVFVLLLSSTRPAAAQQPARAERNRLMIEREAKGILALAHPTVTLTAATYTKTTTFANGDYCLTFKFTWKNVFDQPCYRIWHFHFTKEGAITEIEDGATDTVFPPFAVNNLLLKAIQDDIREQIRTGKLKQNDPIAQLILATNDMRKVTVLLLRLSQ